MKRLHNETNQPFKRGDVREDGYRFFGYSTSVIRANGFFKEIWLSPETWDKTREKDLAGKKARYKKLTNRKPAGYWKWPLEKRARYDEYLYQNK